jgi:hypothetical protein
MDLNKLRDLFPPEMIQWKPQTVSKNKKSALAVAYIDARAVAVRLDNVVGPGNWMDQYKMITFKGKEGMLCTLSICVDGENRWVSKQGFGELPGQGGVDPAKSTESDALKRAAVKWGIARYIYSFPKQWVDWTPNPSGKGGRFTRAPQVPQWAVPEGDTPESQRGKNEALPESGDEDEPEPKRGSAPPAPSKKETTLIMPPGDTGDWTLERAMGTEWDGQKLGELYAVDKEAFRELMGHENQLVSVAATVIWRETSWLNEEAEGLDFDGDCIARLNLYEATQGHTVGCVSPRDTSLDSKKAWLEYFNE